MEGKKQLVVVLSRNYATGLSVIRSIGSAGYTVDLIASVNKAGKSEVAASSKYIRNAVEVVSDKLMYSEDKELVEELLKYAGVNEQKPVLFPTDDYTTSVMDLNRSILEEHFLMPYTKNGSIHECMNKAFQNEMAKKEGLLTPKEWVISLEQCEIPEDVEYPCYCKPISSESGYKTEMAVCNTKEELSEHLARLSERFDKRSVLVQEFLEIDHEIDMSGVCLDQEIIIPAITKKISVAQYAKGVVITGKMVPAEEIGEVQQKLINLLKKFRYTGMFHLDLNVVNGKIYFGEINFRSGGPNYIYFKSGVNLPEIFVKELLGEKHLPEEEKITQYGQSFIYEKIAWDEYLHGFMTREELDKSISEADVTLLYNDDDPEPEKLFIKKMEKKAAKKEAKEACILSVIEATGCEREEAERQIKDARKRLGISYKDYRKNQFCLIPIEEQEETYKAILEKRERRRIQKEKCITSAMETAGWEREEAEQQIKDARERLGISYNDYRKNNFCLLSIEEQEEKYKAIKIKRTQNKEGENNGK